MILNEEPFGSRKSQLLKGSQAKRAESLKRAFPSLATSKRWRAAYVKLLKTLQYIRNKKMSDHSAHRFLAKTF